MAAVKRVREKMLEAGDWQKYPAWFKKVLARRLLLMLIPSGLSRNLPRWLSAPIFGDNAVYPADFAWPDWMVIPPDFEWPDWWTPWMMLDFGPGVTPATAFPLDWKSGDPLPAGVTITPGYPFPDGWTAGDPLPAGVTLEPGAFFPAGWSSGDPLPPGVTIEPTYVLPPDWSPFNPPPPGVDPTRPETWPPDWEPRLTPQMWVFYDPQIDNPDPDTVAPPTLPDIFSPQPKPHTEVPAELPSTTIHLPCTDWIYYAMRFSLTWSEAHDSFFADEKSKMLVAPTIACVYSGSGDEFNVFRAVHKFAIPTIPAGAYFEAGLLYFYRSGGEVLNVVAQATSIVNLDDMENYSKMTGACTDVCNWVAERPIIYLNDDIIDYITAHTGDDIYLMTRHYDHDYLNIAPGNYYWDEAYYYEPTHPDFPPDLVLRYRG